MLKYCIKRCIYMVVIALILSLIMFLVYTMVPFDRADQDARAEIKNNKFLDYDELYVEYQRKYGTDGNIIVRYLRWLGVYPYYNGEFKGIFQGYTGYSTYFGQDVSVVIKEPMKNTIFINIFSILLGLGITIPLGIFCAVKKGTKRDMGIQVFSLIGYSLPQFITAILFLWLFVAKLKWFPSMGMNSPGMTGEGWRGFWDTMYHLALPIIVMTFCSLGGMTRYVRAAMIDALSMDCIRTARAKGLKEKTVIYSHAWRNSLIPIILQIIGWFLGIFTGAMMIENIFALNGMGKLYIDCLNKLDYEVVLALQMFYTIVSLIGNLIIDIAYGLVDPRVRITK